MKAPSKSPLTRLGIRAHDLGRFAPDELACRVAAAGCDSVQLALGKGIEGLEMARGVIDSEMAATIGAAFAKHHVRIDVLGCYINPIHPHRQTRESLLELFKEHLRHARGFGCNIVALESGSLNADYSPHPDNGGDEAFEMLLASMAELVAEAEKCGVVVGIEAVASHVVSTPERMLRLLNALSTPHLTVVFDPVNLLTLENHEEQTDIMQRSLDGFGGRISVAHLKDFKIAEGRLVHGAPGTGLLDFSFLLPRLATINPDIPLLLEEIRPEQVVDSVRFIRSISLSPIS